MRYNFRSLQSALFFGLGLPVVLSACGGGGAGAGTTPSAMNSNPTFTSAASVTYPEAQSTVYVAVATDPNIGDALAFSVTGGPDASLFNLNTVSGQLTFVDLPDFENPADANSDNQYQVTLGVSDGRGGSDSIDVTIVITDVSQLVIGIDFPTQNSNLGGTVNQTRLTGHLTDLEDGEVLLSDALYVDVSGVSAIQDQGNPDFWTADVPVGLGNQVFTISTESSSGSINSTELRFLNQQLFSEPRSVALDITNGRALVPDRDIGLYAVDLASGNRTVLSGGGIGSGPTIGEPLAISLNAPTDISYVIDSNVGGIITVDLSTGNRTVLSGYTNGGGPAFSYPIAVVADFGNNRLLVPDRDLNTLFAVDIVSGNRSILSDDANGVGTSFDSPSSIELDTVNGRALVIDWSSLIAVNLATGDRTVLSTNYFNAGPAISSPTGLALDAANDRVIVSDENPGTILSIDLTTGDRTVISSASIGSGPDFGSIYSFASDLQGNRLLEADADRQALIQVDLTNGNRAFVSDNAVGDGDPAISFNGIDLDVENQSAYLLNDTPTGYQLERLDVATGNRTVISGMTLGTGPNLLSPRDIAVDAANGRALVLGGSAPLYQIMEVNLTTGNRAIISDNSTGSGPGLANSNGIELDSSGNRALLCDSALQALIAIDLGNGDRSIFSDAATGSGPIFQSPTDIAIDSMINRALVVDSDLRAVLAVDLTNGNRAIVSDAVTGSGNGFDFPGNLAIDEENTFAVISENNTILRVDLQNGNRTVVSDNMRGSGVNLDGLRTIMLDSDHRRLFVSHDTLGALLVIDLETGNRAIAAK